MNEKICLIYQPCGLGDILFIQKVVKHWKEKGFKIIIPVVYELEWLNNYIDGVEFISWNDKENKLTHHDTLPENIIFPYKEKYNPYAPSEFTDDFVYLNFFSQPGYNRVMEYKYMIAGLDYSDWSDYLTFTRNKEKEDHLYYNILGLKDDEEYVFVNRNYQTRPYGLVFNRISNNTKDYGIRVVELSIIEGYSIFDWCKVLENASSIHMIETSMNYVLESKQMRDKITRNLNLYSRHYDFREVSYLFKLPWNYITK